MPRIGLEGHKEATSEITRRYPKVSGLPLVSQEE